MLYFILLICRGGGIGRHDRLKICCSLSVGVQVPLPIPHGGKMSKKYDIVVLSGGFDPPHIGHARMIRGAADIAENVIVGVNSDEWLENKKGYIFMPWEERAELVSYFKGVTEAVAFNDDDGTACDLIEKVRKQFPDKTIAFGNGGDRVTDNVPEVLVATQSNVDLVWNLGGGKIQSSSDLVKNANQQAAV